MAFLEWSDTYKCGIRVLDNDHRNLFDIVNTFHDSAGSPSAQETIGPTFNALMNYAREHFEREEGYLASAGYPGLQTHKRAHKALLDQLERRKMQYEMAPKSFDFQEFLAFTQTWITRHILEEDLKFVPYLRGEK